jgi:hypothetical protein
VNVLRPLFWLRYGLNINKSNQSFISQEPYDVTETHRHLCGSAPKRPHHKPLGRFVCGWEYTTKIKHGELGWEDSFFIHLFENKKMLSEFHYNGDICIRSVPLTCQVNLGSMEIGE